MAESTFLAAGHKRRYEVAVPVDLEETLLFHGLPPFRTHQGREHLIIGLDGIQFLLFQRSPAVPDDAAFSLAHGIITGEILYDDVLGHEDVPDFNDGSERSLVSHHSTTISAADPAARVDNISVRRAAVTPFTLSL